MYIFDKINLLTYKTDTFSKNHIFLRNFIYITSKMVTFYSENNICIFNLL